MSGDFAHLHLHGQTSLLDGMIRFDELAKKCVDYGMRSVGLTDHGNMYGTFDFLTTMNKYGIKGIAGMEAYMVPDASKREGIKGSEFHLTLHAMNNVGLKNLFWLISHANTEGYYYTPRIDRKSLREHSEGIICLSGCLSGELGRAIRGEGSPDLVISWFQEVFGDRYYLEIQQNGEPEQEVQNAAIYILSKKYNIKTVATADAHYLNQDESTAHHHLLCIGMQKTRDQYPKWKESYWVKTPDEMYEAFKGHEDALQNSLEIANRCEVTLDTKTIHIPTISKA